MVFHPLEGQHEPVGVKRRPAVAERPPRIRLVHYAAEKRLVEPGQLNDIGTVQHHTLQLGDHEGQRLTTPDHDLQLEYRAADGPYRRPYRHGPGGRPCATRAWPTACR